MIPSRAQEIIGVLSPVLRASKAVLFAYLFGSSATGKTHRHSDVDIAVTLSNKIPAKRFLAWRLAMLPKLCSVLKTDNVDLVVLNDAPLVLRYEIVSSGKIALNAKPKQELEFRLRTMDEYFDTAPMRAMFRRVMQQKIKEGTFLGQSRSL